MHQTTVFNSFTGMGLGEKNALINFICQYCSRAQKPDVKEALDYALKEKPSFGGFVIAIKDEEKFIAAIVVNNTGMQGYIPNNLFAYVALNAKHPNKESILEEIMCKALDLSNGDVALRLDPKNPIIKLYKKLGFTQNTLELRHKRDTQNRAIA